MQAGREGDHVAIPVHSGDVAGVARVIAVAASRDIARALDTALAGIAGTEIERRLGGIDQLAALGGIFFRKQPRIGDLDEVGVAQVRVAIGHGQFDGFGLGVDVVGGIQSHLLEVVAFQDVEREQFGGALVGGGVLVDRVAAVGGGDRLFDLGRIFGEIFVAEKTAVLFGELRHLASDVALVETIARGFQTGFAALVTGCLFGLDQASKSPGEIGILPDVAGRPSLAVGRCEEALARWDISESERCSVRGPSERRPRRVRWPAGGVRRKCGCPIGEQNVPGIDHARNRRGKQSVVDRNLAFLILLVPLDGGEFRRGAFGIQRPHLFRLGIVDQQDGVAADAVGIGVHDSQDGLACDNGVEGITAGGEHVLGGDGGLRHHGGDGIVCTAGDRLHGLGDAAGASVLRRRFRRWDWKVWVWAVTAETAARVSARTGLRFMDISWSSSMSDNGNARLESASLRLATTGQRNRREGGTGWSRAASEPGWARGFTRQMIWTTHLTRSGCAMSPGHLGGTCTTIRLGSKLAAKQGVNS